MSWWSRSTRMLPVATGFITGSVVTHWYLGKPIIRRDIQELLTKGIEAQATLKEFEQEEKKRRRWGKLRKLRVLIVELQEGIDRVCEMEGLPEFEDEMDQVNDDADEDSPMTRPTKDPF